MSSAVEPSLVLSPKRPRMSATDGSLQTTALQRDSLDRFGSDLMSHFTDHLSLEDRFRCECLNHQWQRDVYRPQHRLVIDDSLLTGGDSPSIDVQRVAAIVRKCPNISRVEYYCQSGDHFTDELLDVLINGGCHLQAIHAVLNPRRVSTETLDMFFAKFAKQLLSVTYDICRESLTLNDCVYKNLSRCTNLRELSIDGQSPAAVNDAIAIAIDTAVGQDQRPVFEALRTVAFEYRLAGVGQQPSGDIVVLNADRFRVFIDKYRQTLRTVRVKIGDTCDEQAVDVLMAGLAQITGLIDLQLTYNTINNTVSARLIDGLHRLATCGQLKRLSLHLNYDFAVVLRTINETFGRSLRRLEIRGFVYDKDDMPLRSRALANCRRLTHLTIDYFSQMGAEFFADICHHLPRLEYLWLSEVHITDRELASLATCRRLRVVEFDGNQRTSRSGVQQLVRQLPKIQDFLINDRRYV